MRKLIFTAALAATFCGRADGLKQELLPADTRWLLHLDGDAFRKSRVGAMIVEDKFESKVNQLERDTQTDFNFSFNKVSAVTAFGPKVGEDKGAVLLFQTTADLRGDLEKLIGIKEKNGNGEPPISRQSVDGADLYKIGEDLNAMPAGPNVWLVGKSKTSLQSARDAVLGKAPVLKDAAFLNYPAVTNSFFFLAVAETAGVEKLPAQAKILQKAEGGRVVIGEQGDKVFLNLALRSKDNETLAQIQQVVQGLLAIVTLSQSENKDLVALTSSASVTSTQDLVMVNLNFPLNRALQKVRESDK